jgi:hypothetical protein
MAVFASACNEASESIWPILALWWAQLAGSQFPSQALAAAGVKQIRGITSINCIKRFFMITLLQ